MSEDKKHFEFDKEDFYNKEVMPIIDTLSKKVVSMIAQSHSEKPQKH